ncbi:hypothetical protein [Micromonospora sp. DT62]|uniref:hypothetical protein n=1 Tax=Micromonospora sp. DT62 TaxID=3416521 RepID=UPI003CF582EC
MNTDTRHNPNPYYGGRTYRPFGLSRTELAAWVLERTIEDPDTGCLFWQGAANATPNNIYGVIRMGSKNILVHRLVAEVYHGLSPDQVVDHVISRGCTGLGLCVNPEHLEPVTQRENVIRGWAARRASA